MQGTNSVLLLVGLVVVSGSLVPLTYQESRENQSQDEIGGAWPTAPPQIDWTPGEPFPTLPPGVEPLPPELTATVEIPELKAKIKGTIGVTSPYTKPKAKKMYMFAGIPYADPLSYTGVNRFKPSEIWNAELGEFNALNPIIWCPQSDILSISKVDLSQTLKTFGDKDRVERDRRKAGIKPQVQGTEECLVLNIHTPTIPGESVAKNSSINDDLKPVIVFIHGGSFESMWGGAFGGQRFLNRDVVLVTINYRLGVLGSLNLGINDAPGNAAMYDVLTAIKWIKNYIHYFGGNGEEITVSGQSAGAVLATHLLTTPLLQTAGTPMIKGIISLSGSSLSQWATSTDPITHHLRIARNVNCYDNKTSQEDLTPDDFQEIRDCMALRTSLADLIEGTAKYTRDERYEGRLGFGALVPSMQSDKLTIPKFMVETPYSVMKRRGQLNIPLMAGSTRHDGSMVTRWSYYDFLEPNGYHKDMDFLRNEFIPNFVSAMDLKDDSGELVHSLSRVYIGDALYEDDLESKIPGFIDIHSVLGFKAGAYNLVELHSKLNPNSFYFSFDYSGFWTVDNNDPVIPGGVGHIDVLFYLFQTFPLFMPQDLTVARRFTDYWMNFVIHGNPNGLSTEIIAPPYNPLNHAHLVISGTDYTGYFVRDGWVNNSLEIMRKEAPTAPSSSPENPTETTNPSGGGGDDNGGSLIISPIKTLSLISLFFIVMFK